MYSHFQDRVGLGWRPELAASIFAYLDRIDVVEVIADDYFKAPLKKRRALRTLAGQIPVALHGVGMGLASSLPVSVERIENMARLIEEVQPESWSEHLAFVRAGGYEIGHLAAPPRTKQTIAGALANIEHAKKIVGASPLLENIATLIDPPASTFDEANWVDQIVGGSETNLLIDLHNLYANALNFGSDPKELLLSFPLDKVSAVHLSGGKWIDEPINISKKRLLDDHVHDVPEAVYELLSLLASKATQNLTVIIERDGNYPVFTALLTQIDQAREALKRGRNRAVQAELLLSKNDSRVRYAHHF